MNVSISQIVADLKTTVTGVQSAITMYTLVMAAFMLVGAKLGDILGRDRAFGLGLAVYGLGSLITSLSPNLTVLLIGWSGIEGLGAVLVIPAIAALTAANYEGKERAFAYSMIGGARRRGDRGRAADRRLRIAARLETSPGPLARATRTESYSSPSIGGSRRGTGEALIREVVVSP
jgi:Major Facilitator Superfamily